MANTIAFGNPFKFIGRPRIQWIPWLALVSSIAALACSVASACVVIISHNQIVTSWKIQPAVLLAVFSSVLNAAFNFALTTGVTIVFWLCASRGTELSELHYIWNRGEGISFIHAFHAGSDARRVALVTAFVYMVQFVNGPLLQRSTRQTARDYITNHPMLLDLALQLPDGWTGSIGNGSSSTMIGSRNGLSDIQQWWWNDTMTTHSQDGYSCNGTCEGYVKGAGIDVRCSSTTQYLDLSTSATDGSTIFVINSTMSENATLPFLSLTTLYSSDVNDSCIATLTVDTCDIDAAVVEYPIVIQNSTVSLKKDELQSMKVVSTYVSAGDLPTAPQNAGAGPLAGLNNFFGYYLYANVTEMFDTYINRSTYSGPSMIADLFFQPEAASYDNQTFSRCGLKWSSPTEYVLNSMHEFMFRAALRVGNGTDPQSFTARRTIPALVFRSDERYLAAALTLILLALLALVALLWGWWRLKRPVTLSPLETARTLGAPALQTNTPDATINEILRERGDVTFRVNERRIVGNVGQAEEFKRVQTTSDTESPTEGEGKMSEGIVITEALDPLEIIVDTP